MPGIPLLPSRQSPPSLSPRGQPGLSPIASKLTWFPSVVETAAVRFLIGTPRASDDTESGVTGEALPTDRSLPDWYSKYGLTFDWQVQLL